MSDDFTNTRDVARSRKRYRCYLCHEYVEPGEPYVRASGKTDGEMYSEAMHPECYEKANDPDGDWDWEECFSGDMERPKKGADVAIHDEPAREPTPKWWMVAADGERLCWVPAQTAEIAMEVFRMCKPREAERVREVVRVIEPDDFMEAES